MNLSSLTIDRIVRGVMLNKSTKSAMWAINQITDPSLQGTAENQEVLDYLNTPIASLDRAKKLTLSANNALFDLGLLAAQFGTERNYSTASNTFVAPSFEEFTITYSASGEGSVTLQHTPVGTGAAGIPFIYSLDGSGNIDKKYEYAASAAAGKFSFTGKTLTYPTDLVSASNPEASILVIYDYTANGDDEALEIVNSSDKFPSAGCFVMEVLFRDTCDQSTCYYGYVELPNAKLDANFSINLTPDGKHPFTLNAMQEYCSKDRKLCRFIIPDAVASAA